MKAPTKHNDHTGYLVGGGRGGGSICTGEYSVLKAHFQSDN